MADVCMLADPKAVSVLQIRLDENFAAPPSLKCVCRQFCGEHNLIIYINAAFYPIYFIYYSFCIITLNIPCPPYFSWDITTQIPSNFSIDMPDKASWTKPLLQVKSFCIELSLKATDISFSMLMVRYGANGIRSLSTIQTPGL